MADFTFISITYNQEKYILEHLESIKTVVQNYALGLQINFILSDDGSQDNTCEITEAWLQKNKFLFNKSLILRDGENHGTVRNCLRAIDNLETEHFKILGGDDLYLDKNLFELIENQKNSLIITKPFAFGPNKEKVQAYWDRCYSLLKYASSTKGIRKLITIDNFFLAPGVFICGNDLKEPSFQSFLLQFHNIEDYPMWYYFITKLNYSVELVDEPYIAYRANAGVSSWDKPNDMFQAEKVFVRNKLGAKRYKYPKYINPYRYLLKFYRFRIKQIEKRNK